MAKKILLLFFVISTVSCLKLGNSIPLETKVELFWKARMTGKYTFNYNGKTMRLYDDFLPQSLKKEINEKKFYSLLNYRVLKYEIENIKYNKNKTEAEVKVSITIDFQGYKLENVIVKNKWIKENGDWKIYLKTQSNPFYNY
ncbi:hypothetical protein TTHT_0452 [Thermotomaculum hydrothermale]|uniref:DUF4878 domain-containing protein n=1 Tax=Thermotomaculum hydrothermale TaxID=981385 RepID=A0A7R6PWQ9_9BACT|nr:hypothetical protein [Thermotomaculum hydrothermale]BBB32045.1 hypothetical protein TTHT_0452 [Thermotomaculum hydrothermale]